METTEELTATQKKEFKKQSMKRFATLYNRVKSEVEAEDGIFETMILSVTSDLQGSANNSFSHLPARISFIWWEAFFELFNSMCMKATGYNIQQVQQLNRTAEDATVTELQLVDNSANK